MLDLEIVGELRTPPNPDEQRLLDQIAAREAALVDRVVQWARINSGSRHRSGLDRMRHELRLTFAQLGGEVSEVALPSHEEIDSNGIAQPSEPAPALRIQQRPTAPLRIALTGHYDTVFPADHPFQDVTEIDANHLRGPGVADMKGGLVVLFEALRALEQSANAANVGWEVLLSPDEEIGSLGSRSALAKLGAWAHLGLTYEPALPDGALAGSRKGSAKLSLVVRGRAAHAGREHHLGRNAVVAAARFATALDALNGIRDGTTFNIARIDGGGPTNIVPGLAICRFEVRPPSEADWSWAEAEIERLVDATNAVDGVHAELHGGLVRPPKPLVGANRRLFALAREVGRALNLDLTWRDTGGVCEGNNLWGAGCPNIDTLGVRGGEIHSDREYVVPSSLVERSQLSALLLLRLAGGALTRSDLEEPAP